MNVPAPVKQINVLLVEDNPGDVRLTREALANSKLLNKLYHVEDGAEAIDFLHMKGKHTDAQRVDLILLDLNLPKKSGREVLKKIKEDPELKTIPVVILTTSESDKDIFESYNLHANCYVTKPVDLDSFISIISSIEQFWLSIVELPLQRSTVSNFASD